MIRPNKAESVKGEAAPEVSSPRNPTPSHQQLPNRKGPGNNQPWRGYSRLPGNMTSPRSTSPEPPENLNSQQVRRSDAATN